MPDPNEYPVTGGGLPREDAPQQAQQTPPQESAPQQPQQTQYNYQQTQQSQYGYQQTRQPQQAQYNYQQTQQPQYGYQQARQPQYGYQQAQQPQYGYQQARQPQYGYQQAQQPQYGYRQPYPQQSYGVRQPAAVQAVTHKKAICSMVMMIIALSLLAYPLGDYTILNFSIVIGGTASTYTWLVLLAHLSFWTALILMLVGAIIGSRGSVLFGVGLLLCLIPLLVKRIYYVIDRIGYYEELGVVLILFGTVLILGTLLAGIGCLARIKALKIVGGILMIVNFPIVRILYFAVEIERYGANALDLEDVLYFLGCIFVCIAVLAFPIRRVRASA